MKREHHPIDDFFRKELEEFSIPPSEKAREAFLKDVATASGKRHSGRRWLYTLLGLFLVSVILGLAFLYPEQKPYRTEATLAEEKVSSQPASSRVKSPQVTVTSTGTLSPAIPPIHQAIQEKQPDEAQLKTSLHNPENPGLISSAATDVQRPITEEMSPTAPSTPTVTNTETIPAKDHSDANMTNAVAIPPAPHATGSDSVKNAEPQGDKENKGHSTSNRKWNVTVGVQYSPEWMMNTLEGTKFVNNAGVEGTFHIGRYSITTGIGLSVSKGTNELAVAYNDYLGSYLKLDSMSFEWDERHYHLLPTYFMTEKDVWDSLMKLENAKIVNRYTYLQIPLIFGYDFLIKGKFTMGARIGPILSLLLKTKRISGDYDPGNKQIISINEVTPEQVQTNWQVMAGLHAKYRVNRWLSLEAEPFGKYYFNSVYEPRNSSQKPWSFGIRTAILFNFFR